MYFKKGDEKHGNQISDSCKIGNQKVGIFWLIKNKRANELVIDATTIAEGEKYGNAIQYGGHYEYWEKMTPKTQAESLFKTSAYDAYPRGRVVYFPDKKRFTLYRDKCISHANLRKVIKKFHLEGCDVIFEEDKHYCCAGCNPYYVDI